MQAFSQYRAHTRAALDIRRRQRLSPRVVDAFHDAAIPFFGSAGELFDFQHDLKMPRSLKDDVIGTLLRLHVRQATDETHELLLGIMFPKLSRLFGLRMSRARWGEAEDSGFGASCWPDETWARVLEAFAAAIGAYPLDRRPAKFAENLAWLTIRQLRTADIEQHRRETTEGEIEAVIAPMVSSERPDDATPTIGIFEFTPDEEAPAPPESDELEEVEGLLEECGISDPLNRRIVMAVAVHDNSYAAVGVALGLKTFTVRKRYERARARLARELTRRKRRKELAMQMDRTQNAGKRDSRIGGGTMSEREAKPNGTDGKDLSVCSATCLMCDGTGVCQWLGTDVSLKCEGCGGGGRILTFLPVALTGPRSNVVGRA